MDKLGNKEHNCKSTLKQDCEYDIYYHVMTEQWRLHTEQGNNGFTIIRCPFCEEPLDNGDTDCDEEEEFQKQFKNDLLCIIKEETVKDPDYMKKVESGEKAREIFKNE